jgi:7-keto-8-aminopelargonate synthetase-like enzyme
MVAIGDGNQSKKYGTQFKPMAPTTPLGRLIRSTMQAPEMARMKFFSSLFDAFHLKNTVTTQVRGREIVVNGHPVINFGSANYLGLEQHPNVLAATVAGVERFGNHSGCSRLFSTQENLVELETQVAQLVGAEKSLICVNVSQTHQGAIPALFSGSTTTIFIDKYAHTSMYQAAMIARAEGAKVVRVDIENFAGLTSKMRRHRQEKNVLMLDGVYSMQGHVAPIKIVQKICDENGVVMYLDDAHGIGIYGRNGGGVAEDLDLSYDNMILVGSLQKGLGAFGGFVAAKGAVIDCLRVTSKSYIFSGTLQPHAVHGGLAAIAISRTDEGRELRRILKEKSGRVREGIRALGFKVPLGDSPIIPVLVGSDLKTLMAGRKMFDEGVYVNSVIHPGVRKGGGILRISLSAIHSEAEIQILLQAFKALRQQIDKIEGRVSAGLFFAREILKSKIQGQNYRGLR